MNKVSDLRRDGSEASVNKFNEIYEKNREKFGKNTVEFGEILNDGKECLYSFEEKFEYVEQVNILLKGIKDSGINPVFKKIIGGGNKNNDRLFSKDMIGEHSFIVSRELSNYLNTYKFETSRLLKEIKVKKESGFYKALNTQRKTSDNVFNIIK